MRLYQLMLGCLLLTPVAATAQTKSLADLEATAKELAASKNPFQENDKREQFREDLFKLVDANTFKTSDEFLRASMIVTNINTTFEENRMRHELTFVALAMGNEDAAKRLTYTWDQFLLATGRPQHFGTIKALPGIDDEKFAVNATMPCISAVFQNPVKAKADAKSLASNQEFHDLVTADQAARQGQFAKFTSDQIKAMYSADILRRKQLKVLLQKTPLLTAQDYADAALVMQHGSRFDDYALAHELALCATVLDPAKGRQLVAITWDRMLESGGYHQRVGTQYHGVTLGKVDTQGFNDTMRKALDRQALADVPKKLGT